MTKEKTMISIIIPVFNREAFIQDAIESVLRQSMQSFELIVIDDGSTDRSAEIIKHFVKNDSRVHYYYQPNSGVSVARNHGLDKAQGDYVYFLDSDDFLDKNFIKTSFDAAEEAEADLVVVGSGYESRLPSPMALPTCAQFWKHDFLKKNRDIQFPVGIQPGEDGLFSHFLLTKTDRIAFNGQGIYHYRSHEGQNHRKAADDGDRTVEVIKKWFELLRTFYEKESFFRTKSLHLAQFVAHEPFEYRYLRTALSDEQKQTLMDLIQNFFKQHIQPYLGLNDFNKLGEPFRYFLQSSSHVDFDTFYGDWKIRRTKQLKRNLFLLKFIPVKSYRKRMRAQFREEFSLLQS